MGEPIILHKRGGKTMTVYGRAVADALMASEGWALTVPSRDAGVEEPEVVVAAPEPEPEAEETIAPKAARGKAKK